jgi:hypothetical protein
MLITFHANLEGYKHVLTTVRADLVPLIPSNPSVIPLSLNQPLVCLGSSPFQQVVAP